MGRIGQRGLRTSRQRIYGTCADCGEPRLLVGFLCRRCYGRRDDRARAARKRMEGRI